MNCFQQGHITFALVALIIALYSGRAEATSVSVLCDKHFNKDGKVDGRASCSGYPYIDQDYSCSRPTCETTDGTNIRWSDLTIRKCYNKSGTKDAVHVAQYFRQDSYADVLDYHGIWWHCDFSAFRRQPEGPRLYRLLPSLNCLQETSRRMPTSPAGRTLNTTLPRDSLHFAIVHHTKLSMASLLHCKIFRILWT
ncbi:hypothetical protein Pst134EA_032236 [Puccinia striiformis f. sp. tritici]|uniref:uncharacterized protein n=1 Tax=Puccinia striiformis f. sp. tritici TaxID=168172 RepID=UPI0020079728|nr:uncharacterized protein Pst134EA_032236 [Puccinia striiformis f. sp. tritici]KAH9444361.1 hypothetical protein Pst134EA_032236 [Puccinia striiformis f. sp. tritici]